MLPLPRDHKPQGYTAFEAVFHVSHLIDAHQIVLDGRIVSRPDIRFSCERVAWLSPNCWSHGSFYGNVMFKFDWRKLVEGKRLDWVDCVAGDRPKCRILITAGQPNLGLFENRNQAVYYNQGQDLWCRNEKYNVEFMVDEDLLLSECEAVGFDSHHGTTCKKSASCPDLGQSDVVAGSRFLSGLIASNVLIEHKSLRRLFLNGRTLHKHMEETWREMLRWFSMIQIHGKLTHRHRNAQQDVTWMLEGLAEGRNPMWMAPSLSKMELELALRARAAKAFGVRIASIPGHLTV